MLKNFIGTLGKRLFARNRLTGDVPVDLLLSAEICAGFAEGLAADIRAAAAVHNLGDSKRAVKLFRDILRQQTENPHLHCLLAMSLRLDGNAQESAAAAARALQLDPGLPAEYFRRGNERKRQTFRELAAHCYRMALFLNPAYGEAHLMLGNQLFFRGRVPEALQCYREALRLTPRDGLRIKLMLAALPHVYSSREEIIATRERFAAQLSELEAAGLKFADPLPDIDLTSFYLVYQGMNDRELQMRLAHLILAACPGLAQAAEHDGAPRPSRAAVRVGFFSVFFTGHSVGNYYNQLVAGIAKQPGIDAVVITPEGRLNDSLQRLVGSCLHHVTMPLDLAAARRIIAELALDVLVYADIGDHPLSYFLAFARLAPHQCVLAGHPVTTGIPGVDYFISGELLEVAHAQEHYSEQLVRLRSIPVCFSRPQPPAKFKTRSELGLPEDRNLYICPMKLQKIHPDFDAAVAAILRSDPDAEVVFFQDPQYTPWQEMLFDRLTQSLPDVMDRVRFTDWVSPDDFLGMLAAADVLLDSFHFGSGVTAYIAMAIGTPIVTLPSEFLRGRSMLACYRKMGIMDCVAENPEEYVKIAVRLARDRALRASVKERILQHCAVLYDDPGPAREMAAFFRGLVLQKNSGADTNRKNARFQNGI
jgi:predicted O-linked N-acetylglucosamine transferase (SPINDLY family)